MENKPIKRNKHIVKLSKDHHFALLFCWKIRNGLKFEVMPERIIKYVQYFWECHMQPHFIEEERVLFSPVKDAEVQRALNDHAQIAEQIRLLKVAGDNAEDQLLTLADAVDNHVRYEERELFPHLERKLTEEQLVNIGKEIDACYHPDLKDDFSDEFWVKKN